MKLAQKEATGVIGLRKLTASLSMITHNKRRERLLDYNKKEVGYASVLKNLF